MGKDATIDSLDATKITKGGWTPVLVPHLTACGDDTALDELVQAGISEALATILRYEPSEEAVKALHGLCTGGSLVGKQRHATAIVQSSCAREVLRLTREGSCGAPLLLLKMLGSTKANLSSLCADGAVAALCSPASIAAL